ncbi:uncharacterized protein METZ01_LOCUS471027 [marine metagenome]|uniref:Uncharacterized protein n=1 Tax=marine metagenome TaxID=408172 RepID=A0A383BEB7_9ZZZZ
MVFFIEAIVNFSSRLKLFRTVAFTNRNKLTNVLSVAKSILL